MENVIIDPVSEGEARKFSKKQRKQLKKLEKKKKKHLKSKTMRESSASVKTPQPKWWSLRRDAPMHGNVRTPLKEVFHAVAREEEGRLSSSRTQILEQTVAQLEEENEKLKQGYSVLQEENMILKENLYESEIALEDANASANEVRIVNSDLTADIGELAVERDELLNERDELRARMGFYDNMEKEFSELREVVSEMREENDGLKDSVVYLSTENDGFNEKFSSLNETVEELKKNYFFSSTIALKMNSLLQGFATNVDAQQLYEEAKDECPNPDKWPQWLRGKVAPE